MSSRITTVELHNRMVQLNLAVGLERQDKLWMVASATNITMSELVRYIIEQLENKWGAVDNRTPIL